MAAKTPLTKKDLELLNTHLRELEQIHFDIGRAKAANVPGMDEVLERCVDCKNRAVQLKAVYFPGEK